MAKRKTVAVNGWDIVVQNMQKELGRPVSLHVQSGEDRAIFSVKCSVCRHVHPITFGLGHTGESLPVEALAREGVRMVTREEGLCWVRSRLANGHNANEVMAHG